MAHVTESAIHEQQPNIFERLESNVQCYAKQFPCLIDTAQGATIRNASGKPYIDFLAGAGSLNYGHNNPLLKEALIRHIMRDGVTHSLDFHTTAKQQFLETFSDVILTPRQLDYVVQFTGPTGANAVEAAMKIARKVTGRSNVVSFTNGFHGVSMGALSATGSKSKRAGAGLPLHGTTAMPYEGYLGDDIDTIAYFERMLEDPSSGLDAPAAVIVETVQGEGGLRAASKGWLKRLEALCRKHDMLLIVDDIQAGCGRTETFFSFEEMDITPDIVTLSKSLSGYGLPFAIVLLRPDIDIWSPGEHNGTFRGNNHAFVTATAALENFWRTDEFVSDVRTKSAHLDKWLNQMVRDFAPQIAEARGRGMMRGLVCKDPASAAAISAKAFENGLIVELSGPFDEVIKLLMPLTIESDELDAGLNILQQALSRQFGKLSAVRRPWRNPKSPKTRKSRTPDRRSPRSKSV